MHTPASQRPSTSRNSRRQLTLPDGQTLALVAGDALLFLVFAAIGRASHGEASGLGALGEVVGTAVPFALGWFLVAPFLGAYRRALRDQPLAMLKRTELAWLASWPLAMLLRWLLVSDHRGFAIFALVVLLTNALLLGGWRVTFALLVRQIGK